MPRRPPPPDQRQRKHHRRSRSGCSTCKSKRVKCDELKPICTYCLERGAQCVYQDGPGTGRKLTVMRVCSDSQQHISLGNILPTHAFVAYPIELSRQSRALFDAFVKYHAGNDGIHDETNKSLMASVQRAFSSPASLHSALLVAAVRWSWDHDSVDDIRRTFLLHKLEALRYVNDHLDEANSVPDDSMVTTLASLALAESGLGSIDTVKAHLAAMSQVVARRGITAARPRSRVAQSVFIMLGQCIGNLKVSQVAEICGSSSSGLKLAMPMGIIRASLAPIVHAIEQNNVSGDQTLNDAVSELKSRNSAPASPPPTDAVRQSAFFWCYMNIYSILGRDNVDPFILSWYAEVVLLELNRAEGALRHSLALGPVWLWTALTGMTYGNLCPDTSEASRRQSASWMERFAERTRLVSRLLKIKDWEGVKESLKKFVWKDDFECQEQLRELWEEAVLGRGASTHDNVPRPAETRHSSIEDGWTSSEDESHVTSLSRGFLRLGGAGPDLDHTELVKCTEL